MKTWITTIAIAALTLSVGTSNAEARSHHRSESSRSVYISGYRSCGTPIYTERILVGYDRRGYPVWEYRVVEAPRYYRPEPGPRYYSAPVCPPPRPSYGGYRNSGIVIQGSFRL